MDRMKLLTYLSACKTYVNEQKTRHDIMDFARAILIMLSIMAVLKAALEKLF